MEKLKNLKRVRNHIAHMSTETHREYIKVLKAHFGIIPLKIIKPGEYLLLTSRYDSRKYYLRYYIDIIEEVASKMI